MVNNIDVIRRRMFLKGWFQNEGCYTLFDGQYGSTGKGLLASVIAEALGHSIDTVATNAGPNSGHTGYYNGEKILTQQIPVASVVMGRMGRAHACYLNAGAVIEPGILEYEHGKYMREAGTPLIVHPTAALVRPEHQGDQHSDIASTGKGTGPAAIDKMRRKRTSVVGAGDEAPGDIRALRPDELGRCFVETAQGWSLGINSGFYPYTTHRECGVTQALADLGVSPRQHRRSIVSLRTYPIRVGNTPDGWSGPVYDDQKETTFEAIGQEPELTTVTKRVRRIFTWSDTQFRHMLLANRPDAVFLNFVNYLHVDDRKVFVEHKIMRPYRETMGHDPDFVLLGHGPLNEDVHLYLGE